jgi:hypothetical protein
MLVGTLPLKVPTGIPNRRPKGRPLHRDAGQSRNSLTGVQTCSLHLPILLTRCSICRRRWKRAWRATGRCPRQLIRALVRFLVTGRLRSAPLAPKGRPNVSKGTTMRYELRSAPHRGSRCSESSSVIRPTCPTAHRDGDQVPGPPGQKREWRWLLLRLTGSPGRWLGYRLFHAMRSSLFRRCARTIATKSTERC